MRASRRTDTETTRLGEFWNRKDNVVRFDGGYDDDSMIRRLFGRSVVLRQEMALRLLDGYEHPSVCDIGCGTGRQLFAAMRRGASGGVGIDLSAEMIQRARKTIPRGMETRLEFYEQDAASIDLEQRGFDVVWALGVFDYIRDPQPLLRRMAELSRGHVAASFRRVWAFRNPWRLMVYGMRGCRIYFQTRTGVHDAFERAGLTDITVSRLGSSGYFASGRKVS